MKPLNLKISRYTIFSIICFIILTSGDVIKQTYPGFLNVYWAFVIAGLITYAMHIYEKTGS